MVFRVAVVSTGGVAATAAVRDYVRLLSAGFNVVTTSSPGMVFPDAWVPGLPARRALRCGSGWCDDLRVGARARIRGPLMSLHGAQQFAWAPTVQLVAHALRLTLDDVVET